MTICTVDRAAKSISVVNVLNTKNRYSGICLADNAKFFYAMMQRRKVLTKFKVVEKVKTLEPSLGRRLWNSPRQHLDGLIT